MRSAGCLIGLILIAVIMACAGPADIDRNGPKAVEPMAEEVAVADTPRASHQPAVDGRTREVDAMEMVIVPGGEFQMGDDRSPYAQERPQHVVELSAYVIDRYEVTNSQYRMCVEAGVCAEPSTWSDPNLNGDAQPALVGWPNAESYCLWAGVRLPTESEWEKAARGTDARRWPWGDEYEKGRANLSGGKDGHVHTAPVGSFAAGVSPYGVHDMAGNASEWVADWYDPQSYSKGVGGAVADLSDGKRRVYRSTIANGGGGPEKSRTCARYAGDPSWNYGFRCATSDLEVLKAGSD